MTTDDAVRYFGTKAELARQLGITRASVSGWREIPIDRQCQIEVITGGRLLADRDRLQQIRIASESAA
jgi:biotin operon repressor